MKETAVLGQFLFQALHKLITCASCKTSLVELINTCDCRSVHAMPLIKNLSQCAYPGYPRRVRQSQRGSPTYNSIKFSQKLHENERKWAERGARPNRHPCILQWMKLCVALSVTKVTYYNLNLKKSLNNWWSVSSGLINVAGHNREIFFRLSKSRGNDNELLSNWLSMTFIMICILLHCHDLHGKSVLFKVALIIENSIDRLRLCWYQSQTCRNTHRIREYSVVLKLCEVIHLFLLNMENSPRVLC